MGDMEEELAVCPVRCLRHYLNRTNFPVRPNNLFLSPKNNLWAISKNGVSFFLKDLISRYGSLRSLGGPRPRAHSMRYGNLSGIRQELPSPQGPGDSDMEN